MYKLIPFIVIIIFSVFSTCSSKHSQSDSNIFLNKIVSDTIPINKSMSSIVGKWAWGDSKVILEISRDSVVEIVGKYTDRYSYQLYDTATFEGKTIKLENSYYLYLLQNNIVEFIYQIFNLNDSILSLSKAQSNDIITYRRLSK